MKPNRTKRVLAEGGIALGTMVFEFGTIGIGRIVARTGADFVIFDMADKIRTANAEGLLIAQIETVAGLEQVERIAAVDGIDVLWIGHFDLTNSLGIPAEFEHPSYLAAVERVLSACRQYRKAAGFMVASPEEARIKLDQGFRCLAYWGDLWIYQQALSAALQRIRA